MRSLAFVSLKGGVGKTTLTLALALHWAEEGRRVLAVDLDPQANLTMALRPEGIDEESSVRMAIRGYEAWPLQVAVEDLSIWLLGADEGLWETDLKGFPKARWREIAQNFPSDFDFAILDTPTGLRSLTTLAILLSDAIVIPLDPSPFAVAGLARLMATLERIRKEYGKGTTLLGVVLSLAERTRLCWETEASLKDLLGDRFLGSIRRTVRLKEAISSLKAPHRLKVPAGEELREISGKILERMEGLR